MSVNDEPIVTLDEYYLSIDDLERRTRIQWNINQALGVFQFTNNEYGLKSDDPRIRVRMSDIPIAEGMSGCIHISSKMIEDCVFAKHALPSKIFKELIADDSCADYVGVATLIWVFGHEWIHEIRCWREVTEKFGTTKEVAWALELDADLCAIAVLYRRFQFFQNHDPDLAKDIGLRKLVIYSLFWGIRVMKSDDSIGMHPPLHCRIAYLLEKLSQLNIIPGDRADSDNASPRTQSIREELRATVASCERYYMEFFASPEEMSIVPKIIEYEQSGRYGEAYHYWAAICSSVQDFSNTLADLNTLFTRDNRG